MSTAVDGDGEERLEWEVARVFSIDGGREKGCVGRKGVKRCVCIYMSVGN